MNSLSWMIYLAGVSGTLSFFSALGAVALFIAAAFKTMGVFGDDFSAGHKPTKRAARTYFSVALKGAIPLAVLSALLPGSNTIYAIAASELGESALNSETGGKAVEALNAWLDRQIAGEPEEAK